MCWLVHLLCMGIGTTFWTSKWSYPLTHRQRWSDSRLKKSQRNLQHKTRVWFKRWSNCIGREEKSYFCECQASGVIPLKLEVNEWRWLEDVCILWKAWWLLLMTSLFVNFSQLSRLQKPKTWVDIWILHGNVGSWSSLVRATIYVFIVTTSKLFTFFDKSHMRWDYDLTFCWSVYFCDKNYYGHVFYVCFFSDVFAYICVAVVYICCNYVLICVAILDDTCSLIWFVIQKLTLNLYYKL